MGVAESLAQIHSSSLDLCGGHPSRQATEAAPDVCYRQPQADL